MRFAQCAVTVLLASVLLSCSSQLDNSPDGMIPASKFDISDVEVVKVTSDYAQLTATVEAKSGAVVPQEGHFSIRGEKVLFRDDGNGLDQKAGDHTFTARMDRSTYAGIAPSEDAQSKVVSCEAAFVTPGEQCMDYGECPDESLLGGDTWFCVCVDFQDCEVGF